jgi:hypothetical protein
MIEHTNSKSPGPINISDQSRVNVRLCHDVRQPQQTLAASAIYYTSLNPVPNAQVCVFNGTYYKITTRNYISKTSLYTTFRMYPSGPWPLKILMFALLVTSEIAPQS